MTRAAAAMLIESSIRALIVAGAVGAILKALRIRSSAVRHTAWRAVLCGMVLMPVLIRSVPPIAVTVPFSASRPTLASDQSISVREGSSVSTPSLADARSVARISPPLSSVADRSAAEATPGRDHLWPIALAALGALYACGLFVLLTRLILGWRATARIVSHAVDSRFHESALVAAPVTVGVFAPKIILPSTWRRWPQEKLSAVLAHEQAHVRRRDPLFRWLAHVNRCVFWFHPLAWWLERTLAATAEDACDDAAVRAIGATQRYAEILVETANEVRKSGGRIAWQGVGVEGNGLLAHRIDRLLRGAIFQEVTSLQKFGLSFACGAVIVLIVACRPASPPPLQPDAEIEERLNRQRLSAAFDKAARELTTEQVESLEASLRATPDDVETRRKLLIFYRWVGQHPFGWDRLIAARRPHVLWMIEHHPAEAEKLLDTRISARFDPDGYAAAKKLWLAHTAKANAPVDVLGNAARFLDEADTPLAEQLLLRAQAADPAGGADRLPSGTVLGRWSARLGRLYAFALVGGTFEAPGNIAQAHGPYAAEVRRKLAASKDDVLLMQTGQYLSMWYRRATVDFDPSELGRSFIERAIQLNPQSAQARAMLADRQRNDRFAQQREPIRDVPRDARPAKVAALPDAERLSLLPQLASEEYMGAEATDFSQHDRAKAEAMWARSKAYAEDALALARRRPDDRMSAFAAYSANVTLATHALREGNRQMAVRYMREATRVPSSADLSYARFGLDSRLVNYLLMAGERTSVIEFLERSAQLRPDDKDRLLKDASAIRAGKMPGGFQYMMSRR